MYFFTCDVRTCFASHSFLRASMKHSTHSMCIYISSHPLPRLTEKMSFCPLILLNGALVLQLLQLPYCAVVSGTERHRAINYIITCTLCSEILKDDHRKRSCDIRHLSCFFLLGIFLLYFLLLIIGVPNSHSYTRGIIQAVS